MIRRFCTTVAKPVTTPAKPRGGWRNILPPVVLASVVCIGFMNMQSVANDIKTETRYGSRYMVHPINGQMCTAAALHPASDRLTSVESLPKSNSQ
jgi:hypothetical protein